MAHRRLVTHAWHASKFLLLVRTVAVCLFAWAASGCSSDRLLLVDEWRVRVEGAPEERTLRVPVNLDGDLPSHASRYRLTADVAIPQDMRHRTLTLAIPYLMAPISLRADGREVASLDQDVWEGYRGRPSHRWRLPLTEGPTLRLELTVEHRSGLSARVDSVPRLSATMQGDSTFLWLSLFQRGTAFLAAAPILLGCLYFFLFLLDRRKKSHAWFGIGTILASYYGLYFAGVTQALFGVYDAAGLVITLIFALLCSAIYFLHSQFELGRPPRAFLFGAVVIAILSIVFRDPFKILRVAPLIILFTHAAIGYALFNLLRLRRRHPPPLNVNVVLASWVVIVVTSWSDMLVFCGYAQLVGSVHTGCFGIVLYAILQMVVLSHEHTAHVRHIDFLNQELKRQLRGRTHELAQAFNLVGSGDLQRSDRLPGETIAGRYRVASLLGRGGSGVVYEVERLADASPFALKVLDVPSHAVARFTREAGALAKLAHPNLVPIVDFGVAERGEPFVVTELVAGTTLEKRRSSQTDIAWAMAVLRQIGFALDAIHASGIVHGDLKPANVLLSEPADRTEPVARLTDFGLSGLVRPERDLPPSSGPSSSATRTVTGDISAPGHLAPELRRGTTRATCASDLFSLGWMAYELLVGRLVERRVSFVRASPQVSPAFRKVIDSCLSTDPAERPGARAFAMAASELVTPIAAARGS